MDLREWLFRNRMSVTDFAKQLGVSRNHINRIVNGYGYPGTALAKLIEQYTQGQVTTKELLKEKE